MEETYQLIEGSPTLRDLDAENGFLWCPLGYSGRLNEPGILVSRLNDGSYDVRLGIGLDSPVRFAIRDLEWSWMDMVMDETVELTFPDDMALNDWIASETTATGAAWARCFNPYCGPDEKTLNTSEIIDTLKRFESPSYLVRGPIEKIESLPVGYYWSPDAVDPDPSYNGYLLNVFAGFDGHGFPAKSFELFGGVTLNDVPSFGFDDGWDGFTWLNVDDAERSAIAFLRTAHNGRRLVCVCNFTPVRYDNFVIGLPRRGVLRELLSSDSEEFGGSGVHNAPEIRSENVPFGTLPCSARVTLPLAYMALTRDIIAAMAVLNFMLS